MKKLFFLLFAGCIFCGCLKKNDTGSTIPRHSTPPFSVTGIWYYVTDTTRQYVNNKLQSAVVTNSSKTSYFNFNVDRTGTQVLVDNNGVSTTRSFTARGSDYDYILSFAATGILPAYVLEGQGKYVGDNKLEFFFNSTDQSGAQTTETIVLSRD